MNQISGQIIGNYQIEKRMGKGTFSSVFKAIHVPTQSRVALKVIHKIEMLKYKNYSVHNEVSILRSLRHPFIAEFFDFFEDESFHFIVLEYVGNGSLFDYIQSKKQIKEEIVRRIFMQLLSVLQYLHEVKNIIHRDLKPQNIMLDENFNIRLIDFGLSICLRASYDVPPRQCGSPYYIAPEMILEQPHTYKSDLWSAGNILYVMISGSPTFLENSLESLFRLIIKNEPDYSNFSSTLAEVLKSLLSKHPQKRANVLQIKEYEWFHGRKYFTKSSRSKLF
jgi:non-specific serine/threonine protein kinase